MPIRLNLLAEAQAAEEIRRRDPVKRIMWIAALLVCLMLVWSSSLQLKAMLARSDLGQTQGRVADITNSYQTVIDNQRNMVEIEDKLTALHRLATNRLLNGSLLNALQHTTVQDVNLMHLNVAQSYTFTDAVKAKTSGSHKTPGRPATETERIVVTLDAKDSSANPGDQIARFRAAIATNAYFQSMLGQSNEVKLTKYSPAQGAPGQKPFVLFTVQCVYPEKTR